MPTYDYKCTSCGHELEAFHAMSAEPLVDCPQCNQPELIKLVGMGAAVIVRGTETPCHGGRSIKKQRMQPNKADRLGEGKNKTGRPWWRKKGINKKVLKNPKKYIQTGDV